MDALHIVSLVGSAVVGLGTMTRLGADSAINWRKSADPETLKKIADIFEKALKGGK